MVLTKTYWKSKSFSQRFAERKSATGAVKKTHKQSTSCFWSVLLNFNCDVVAYKEGVGFANLGNPIQAFVSSVRPKQQKLRAVGENVGPGKDFIALAW